MARSLPAKVENSPKPLDPYEEKVLNLLANGVTPAQLARKLAPDDKKKRKHLRTKFRRIAYKPNAQMAAAQMAKANLVLGVLPASEAIVRKAAAGRIDAAKLLFEASGFHNPRTEVNHSGDIQITIKSVARPAPVKDDVVDVTDAEIVD